jgi:hypothetical protein
MLIGASTTVYGANNLSKSLGKEGSLIRNKGVLGAAYEKTRDAAEKSRRFLSGEKEPVQKSNGKVGTDHPSGSFKEPHNKSPLFNDNTDYTTDPTKTSSPQEQIKTQADNDRAKVRSIDPQDAGKMQMRSDLDAAAEHYPKDAPEQTRIRQMQDALDHGESIKAESFKEVTGKDLPSYKDGNVNVKRVGEKTKMTSIDAINTKEFDAMHATDSVHPKSKDIGEST